MITAPVTPCLCEQRHTSYNALASCLWPDARQVEGEGPYVLVATPAPGRRPTALLWIWVDDALDAKLQLDETARSLKTGATTRVYHLYPDAIDRRRASPRGTRGTNRGRGADAV